MILRNWNPKIIFALLALIILFMVSSLTGCGKKTSSDGTIGKTVHLKLGLPSGFNVTPKEIVELFEQKNPDIKVTIDDAPWNDYGRRVQLQMMSSDNPDIWFLESGVIMSYGAMGVAENLKDFVAEKEKAGKYLMLEDTKDSDGNVWGIPHALQPTALAYNKKMFDEAGLAYPDEQWTFEDLIDNARKLTRKDASGNTYQYGFVTDYSITVGYYPWIKGLGGHILDETKSRSLLNSSATKKAIQSWADLAHKEKIFPPYTTYKADKGSSTMFGVGKAAMFFIQYVLADRIHRDFSDIEWDVAPMPISVTGKRYVPYVANAWVIYKKAKPEVKEAALRWLDFWLSDEAQMILAEQGINIPVNKVSFEKAKKNLPAPASREVFVDYLDEAGANLDLNSTWNAWNPIIANVMERIYGQRIGVDEGIAEMHREVDEILRRGVK